MANPLDVLGGAPVVMTAAMVNAFKDVLVQVEDVPGNATLWDVIDYIGRNTGGSTIALDDLSDVEFKTPPENGETLIYNAGDDIWENGDVNADLVEWTTLETTDLEAEAQSEGITLGASGALSFGARITREKFLHFAGRIIFPGGGIVGGVGGTVIDFFAAGSFFSYPVATPVVQEYLINNPDGEIVARFTMTTAGLVQITIPEGVTAAGNCYVSAPITIN